MMDPHFVALGVGHSIPDENLPVISNINYGLIGINVELYEEYKVEYEANENSIRLVFSR